MKPFMTAIDAATANRQHLVNLMGGGHGPTGEGSANKTSYSNILKIFNMAAILLIIALYN